MFSAHNFFGGWPPFLDLRYKAHLDFDHVAKFHGDRPRELGDNNNNSNNPILPRVKN